MNAESIDWNDPQFQDPMEELYAIRRQISIKFDHSIHKICEAVREKEARAKSLGMTYGEYCLAQLEGTLPLFAHEDAVSYDPKTADSAQPSRQE